MKQLDKIDYKILGILQKDGSVTNQELARQVDLAPSSCFLWLRHLEEDGYINGYHARVNLHSLCRFVTCIVNVNLKSYTYLEFFAFKAMMASIPEIVECYTVSGECDFILKMICRDMPAYLAINDKLTSNLDYIASISSYVVMDENKAFTNVNLETLI